MSSIYKIWVTGLILVVAGSCVKPFNPPAVSAANLNYLVVDGFIVPGSASTIRLSRTLNITDSFRVVPELNAQLYLEGMSGSLLTFQTGVDNAYTCPTAFLSPDEKYRLRIILQDGKEYLSDYAEVKQSPTIDTVEWEEDGDVSIYVSTRDPSGKARYYKWDYEETVEYRAAYEAVIDFIDGEIVPLEVEQIKYRCYKYYTSNNIILGNSSALSEDVILRNRVTIVPNDNTKISQRYSILVRQYALTAEAYKYWQILQANTEQSGNLFDPQPAQLRSNIHSVANPDEPVIGYFSISNFTEKRIFIRAGELTGSLFPPPSGQCEVAFINPADAAYHLAPGSGMKPAYMARGRGLAIARDICVDCTLQGGTIKTPPYW